MSRGAWLDRIFTAQERKALAFLLALFFLGLGVMAWRGGAGGNQSAPRWEPVAVNRAGASELASLPGIGPVTARRIIEHRRARGRFLILSDLARVKGISRKTLERLEGLLRFD